jgi:hypothetical protein
LSIEKLGTRPLDAGWGRTGYAKDVLLLAGIEQSFCRGAL